MGDLKLRRRTSESAGARRICVVDFCGLSVTGFGTLFVV